MDEEAEGPAETTLAEGDDGKEDSSGDEEPAPEVDGDEPGQATGLFGAPFGAGGKLSPEVRVLSPTPATRHLPPS